MRLRDLLRRVIHELAAAGAIAIAYYVGCLAGFALRYPSSGISFLWPPNALLLTGLLIVTRRRWPALISGALAAHSLAHAQDGIPIAASLVQYFGNASQALLAASIMRRFDDDAMPGDFRRLLVFLVGACIVAPAVASVAPASIYVTLGWANGFFAAWRARAVSNAVATLGLVPPLLALWRSRVQNPKPLLRARRVAEFSGLLVGLAATYGVAAAVATEDLLGLSVLLSATAPFLIWASTRFGVAGLSMALSAVLLMMSKAAIHMSPVAADVPADAVVGAQLLLMATAIPLSLLAGLLQQQHIEHQALVDLEHQNRATLRALPDATILHTREGAILRSYPRRIHDAFEGSDLAGDSVPPSVIAKAVTDHRGAHAQQARVTEYTHGSDETARRFEARSAAVDNQRMVTIIRDVTERWRSQQALLEAQLRHTLALGIGGIGLWEYDVARAHFHVEGTLKSVLGYDDETLETLSDWKTVILEEDREHVFARLSALASGATHSFETEFRLSHKNKSVHWVSTRGVVTNTEDGRPSRIVGTYADITELRETGRALEEANERLARLGRIAAMSELTASLAHELNQPLTAISANVVACLRELDSTRDRGISDALNDVLRDSRRASKIIERTQRLFGNRPTQAIPLNLNDVVREVVRIVAPRLRELGVRVRLALDPSNPNVHVDDVQMQQVLLNLAVNAADALHATELERKSIYISVRHTRRYVVVSVRDNGMGLDRADVTRIFEPFYTTKTTGTGMGLAISRSIVRSHGGTLWAVANRDGGSTFRFKIPLVGNSVSRDSPLTRRVLVVDDNRDLRRALTRLLRSCGYQVAVASNGTSAIALTEVFKPDAMVVDISLGDMTGLDLAKRLRAIPAERPLLLIALTAYENDDLRHACIAAGFDRYLVKQTQIAELPVSLQRGPH